MLKFQKGIGKNLFKNDIFIAVICDKKYLKMTILMTLINLRKNKKI